MGSKIVISNEQSEEKSPELNPRIKQEISPYGRNDKLPGMLFVFRIYGLNLCTELYNNYDIIH